MTSAVTLALPFEGRWRVRNSPARRVPSHGTDLMGERYAVDFVPVDHRHRSAQRWDWRTVLGTEPPGRFVGYGRSVMAPADGVVATVHDGEVDHDARRSPFTQFGYALSQRARMRQGVEAIAGNHVVIALPDGSVVALVHLRTGSLAVGVGDAVVAGQPLAGCGNTGNSTQPHVHLQVMDRTDLATARGVPIVFDRYREWPPGSRHPRLVERGLPVEGAVIEPV